MYTKVTGKNMLIFADLHFSDIHTGRCKNYLSNCMGVLGDMLRMVRETKPCAVVLLGDIVGVSETNIRSRLVLGKFCQVLQEISKTSEIIVVRGNHDNGDYPEYQFLSDLGFFKTSEMCKVSSDKLGYFDYFASEDATVPELRFHLMDYGQEDGELDLSPDENTTDIVLAHNNFTIQGCTNWYADHDGIELCGMNNLKDVYMLISGHIHNPSPQDYATEMRCGGTCHLFYPGCPTRPSTDQNYESCWVVRFEYEDDGTNWYADEWELAPLSDVFYNSDEFVEEKPQNSEEELERKKALKEVLDDIIKCRVGTNNLIAQIDSIPNASDSAKNIAKSYLQNALNLGQ